MQSSPEIHLNIEKINIAEVPVDGEKMQNWLDQQFRKKDRYTAFTLGKAVSDLRLNPAEKKVPLKSSSHTSTFIHRYRVAVSQYVRDLNCLAHELTFLVMQEGLFMINQVKQKRA